MSHRDESAPLFGSVFIRIMSHQPLDLAMTYR
jgi:hypothetical protein